VEDCFGAARGLRDLTQALLADLEAAAAADRAFAAAEAALASGNGNNHNGSIRSGSSSSNSSSSSNATGSVSRAESAVLVPEAVRSPSDTRSRQLLPPPAGVGSVFLRHCNLGVFLEGYVEYTRGYKEGRHKLEQLQRKFW
jgi:hypothetical protein